MDFYKKKRVQIVRYIVLLSASILLLINGYESYSDKSVNYSAIISNILLIWAMFLAIKQEEKEVVAKPQNP